jgi:hypothetical protein
MRSVRRWLIGVLLAVPAVVLAAQAPPAADTPVAVTIETSLRSAIDAKGSTGQIRQFAFDGDPKTYFASAENATSSDHFTLTLDRPAQVRSIKVITGRPNGEDRLDPGKLEVSADGKTFTPAGEFKKGTAHVTVKDLQVQAVRIRPAHDLKHPLTIREIEIDANPPIAVFQHPIEVVIDVSDAPELKEWAEKCARLCERHYPMICEELASRGFKPRTMISMTLKSDYQGVAAAGGGRITGSVKYFKGHPDDMGAMIHETVHCVQSYRTRGNPGWLVEGVADYIRFFKYEPGKIGKINAERARYNGSYRVTAAFLAYVSDKHDKQLVRKLNQAMREGEYREEIWKALTKKTVQELDTEWRETLQQKREQSSGPVGREFFEGAIAWSRDARLN